MDPYRSSSALPCARCSDVLDRTDDGFDCPRGCGFWDPDVRTVGRTAIGELGKRVPTQLHPGRCPTCRQVMELRRWQGVTLDVCARHGCWVAAGDRAYYLECLKAAGA
jgi:hypothetical protein